MKGHCYKAAYKAARELHADAVEGVWLVHGFVTTAKAGRIAHAWVELEGSENSVLDLSNGQSFGERYANRIFFLFGVWPYFVARRKNPHPSPPPEYRACRFNQKSGVSPSLFL
jgi:hypothetical protein